MTTGWAGEAGVPGDFAVVIDAQGLIMAWSEGARRLLGYRPEDVLGREAADLLAAELPRAARRHVAAGKACTSEVALRHRDESRVVVRLRAVPLAHAPSGTSWLVTGTHVSYPSGPSDVAAARLWDRTLAQLPLPVAVYDRDALFVSCNEMMCRLMGRTEDEMKGLPLREIEPGWPYEEYDRLQREVLRTGEGLFRELYRKGPGSTREQAVSVFLSPLKDESGAVRGLSAMAVDTTEQYWARRRLVLLNDASVRIGTSLGIIRTAEELAEVSVTGLADFVAVDLLEPVADGGEPEPVRSTGDVVFRRAAQRSVLPGCPESVVPVGGTDVYPSGSLPVQVLISGRGTRHRTGEPPLREWVRASRARDESLRRHMIHSVMMVPLRARGVTLGLVHFLRHRTSAYFSRDDVLLAEEIVARAAVSVDNARRYTKERRTALALQRSLLPERLPRVAALDVAYRYLPAGSGNDVGGDWFDVIPLSGARVALVVGDVVGHGIRASATMGRLRSAVRALADVDLPPDELLTHLDDLVLRLDREEGPDVRDRAEDASGEVGATCMYAVYDPVSRRCSVARAGHPPPVVAGPDGSVRLLDLPAGPPLGLGGLPFESAETVLPEGSLLALYTDGLVESADRDIDVGLDLLREAMLGASATLDESCDHILRKVLPEQPTDDIVLILARTRALDADHVGAWHLPLDPAAVAGARRTAGEQVADWGLAEQAFSAELIVSELVTNAIRYGDAPLQLRLIRDKTLICEVSDGSSTAPHLRRARTFDEGGRGLLLVAQIAERWGTRQTPTGKTIWAELPLR
ncbi:SpoIIE family protein phosphatase [Streptomyces sp. HPF1205]|uniref:SpoIIE family protein phosphatase n=1 Tax=Streptomyces sp. HPF1205 TaxID=2873262 RepID=UPI001CEDD3C9|nr:SpoIIE family protein phosphatase [Streptomyces sp. HPF1205]